jgi:hypothetical protein
MNRARLAFVTLLPLALLAGCPDNSGGGGDPDLAMNPNADMSMSGNNIEVSGEITSNTMWTKNNTYLLRSQVFVVNGATLTIQPGTVIKGTDPGSALIVTTTGKIIAEGTKDEPIVFTSGKPVGMRKSSDWGGVVLMGKAKINTTAGEEVFEALPSEPVRGKYGGGANPDDAHNCGSLRYVRIEFAGYQVQQNKELNGLTVCACGSTTALDYIQVHRGSDDGIEFFGGTANLKHAVVTLSEDDGLDWDQGYTGKIQFYIVQFSATAGNHGIEASSNKSNALLPPQSSPVVRNFTFVGSKMLKGDKEKAAVFNQGTRADIANAIFMNSNDYFVDIQDPCTVKNAKDGLLKIVNTIFFGNSGQTMNDDDATEAGDCGTSTGGTPLNEYDHFLNGGMSAMGNLPSDPLLTDPTNITAPKFKPQAASPALVPGNAAPKPADPFFEEAPYLGAIGTVDWTEGWTAYPAN